MEGQRSGEGEQPANREIPECRRGAGGRGGGGGRAPAPPAARGASRPRQVMGVSAALRIDSLGFTLV